MAAAAALGAAAALFAPGCGGSDAAPADGSCRTATDCPSQSYGRACVDGRCVECGVDADCKEGFVCRTTRCVPKPQCAKNADCPEGLVCRDDRCVVP